MFLKDNYNYCNSHFGQDGTMKITRHLECHMNRNLGNGFRLRKRRRLIRVYTLCIWLGIPVKWDENKIVSTYGFHALVNNFISVDIIFRLSGHLSASRVALWRFPGDKFPKKLVLNTMNRLVVFLSSYFLSVSSIRYVSLSVSFSALLSLVNMLGLCDLPIHNPNISFFCILFCVEWFIGLYVKRCDTGNILMTYAGGLSLMLLFFQTYIRHSSKYY